MLRKVLAVFMLMLSGLALSQTPQVSPISDESDFPGSSICSTVSLTNAGPTGYGPYLRIVMPPGVSLDSASLFGGGVSVTTVGAFPTAPGNELTDPVTGEVVMGNEGDVLYIVQPPVGSVVTGGIPLDIEICYSIDPAAPVNVPIPVEITPVYEFGDTPTGENGPITGSAINFNVTPILVEFEKTNDAPEGERPPGDDWPVTYTLVARVAPNNSIDNLIINDVLPAGFVLDVPSITVPGGCVLNTTNPINVSCASVNGTGGDDVVITYSGHFDDILDESNCASQSLTNNATLNGDFMGSPIPQANASSDVQVEHFSVQKSANVNQASPGDTVTFTLAMQLSEFATANALVIQDTLDDGYTFVAGSENSSLGAVTAGVSVVAGVTTLTFDLHAVNGGNVTGGAPAITLTYQATVDQTYDNSAPVLASDTLNNQIIATYDLTGGASMCTDTSSHTVGILPVSISKSILGPQPFYEPGDSVTYRLTMQVPSGDTNGVIFTDYLPLPVLDANTVSTVFGVDIVHSPGVDTLGLIPTSITTNGGTNSVEIQWPNISTATPQTLSVDLTVTITTAPFADNLNLSNLLAVQTENTDTTTATNVTPVNIQVRAPELAITKGVQSADQGSITPPPATLPVDGDLTGADGNDNVSFMITVENVGGARAFDVTITDPVVPGLTACVVSSVIDGTGAPLATIGNINTGLTLTNPLAANDGSLGAPYADDTALVTYDCLLAANVAFDQLITNSASANFAGASGGPVFPAVIDDATVLVASPAIDKTIVSITPNVDGVNNTITVGEVINYQVVMTFPEGVSNAAQFIDRLDDGLLHHDNTPMNLADPLIIITPSAGISTNLPGGFAAAGTNPPLTQGGRTVTVGLGNLTSSSTGETLTFNYFVLVDDAAPISDGVNRNNRADFVDANIAQGDVRDTAPNRRVREPSLNISKSASPVVGDAGDTVTYTVTATNTGQSPAFDVDIQDLLSDPNLSLVTGTVSTSQGSVTTGNTGGDTTVLVEIPSINRTGQAGDSVTISFDVLIGGSVTVGAVLTNMVSVTNYNSIPGGGRAYPQVNASTDVSVTTSMASKTVLGATSSEQSGGIDPIGDGSLVDLTIGEQVTFEIVATLAEGVSPAVVITDTLPDSATGQMQLVSAAVIAEGGNLTVTNSFPAPAIGPANVVSFDFGQVTNMADGVINANDQIVVHVIADVTNNPGNQGIETLTNTALIQFNTGLDASVSADIEVVEPLMSIDKSSATTTGDAGDTVTFVVTVDNLAANGSSANAFDVTMTDVLPAGFSFAGNLMTDSGLVPDTLTETGGTITATWASYPLGSTTQISFDTTIDVTVAPEQVIQNTAMVGWDSLPGNDPEQRPGSDNDGHSVTIGMAGMTKLVAGTSEASTGTSVNGPEDDLTIGEQVTYEITITLPEGTTPGAVMTDQLPLAGSILGVVSSQISGIGSQITLGAGALGTPGVATDNNADTYNDRVVWNLGDIINAPDGNNDVNDQVTFEVVALVVDEPINQGGANDIVNQARLDYDSGVLLDTALVDLVEPVLAVTKETIPAVIVGDAGDVLNYRITIEHTATSTADALNIQVMDVLPTPGTVWINDGTVSSTCPGIATNSTGEPVIIFSVPTLGLATSSCTIDYQVMVDGAINPGDTYQNMATVIYDSGTSGDAREGSDTDAASFDTAIPAIVKTSVNSSLNQTNDAQGNPLLTDLVIGELVDFDITITLPESTVNNAIIQDNLPLAGSGGVLAAISGSVVSVGNNITTSLPGTAVLTNTDADSYNDQIVFDFGTITNTADGLVDANDQITVRITAQVVDVIDNANGDVLVNQASLDFLGAAMPIMDEASVEIVEPNLGFTKSMGPVVNGVVPITLTLDNLNGNAPVFDILITDVLSDAVWDLATITPVNIPAGFVMNVVPGVGNSTVEIQSDPGSSSPDNSLEIDEQIVFVFSVQLRDDVTLPNPVLNTATVTEINSTPGVEPEERDYSDLTGNAQLGFSELDSTKTDTLLIDNNTNGVANPGDTIRYTIVIDNTGLANATLVTFNDTPDSNSSLVVGSVTTSQGSVLVGNTAGDTTVSIDVGTIAPSGSVTITFDVVIDNPFPVGVTQISNQGTVDSDEFPPSQTDDPDTVPGDDPTITPVVAEHDLVVTKDDGGITVNAGGTITYSINFSNAGDQNSTGVVLTETVPATTVFNPGASAVGWVCVPDNTAGSSCTFNVGNLNGGQSGSTTYAVDVFNPKPTGVTQIDNTVSIADDGLNGPETNMVNNTDTEDTPVDAAPDLTLVKTDAVSIVAPGGVIVYNLAFENVGTQDATGVVITETVPANTMFAPGSSTVGWVCVPDNSAGSTCTFNVGNLNAGDPAQNIQFAVLVDDPVPGGVDQINNSASIADDGSNGPDTNPGNNGDSEITPVGAAPDMFISKTDGDVTTTAGGLVVYTLNYGNAGTQGATGVVIAETVPANTTFDPANSSAGWACVPDNTAGSTCTLAVGNVDAGDSGSVDFAITVDDPLPSGVDEVLNTTTIADDGNNGPDPDPGNNTGSDNTPVDAAPDLTLTKTDSGVTSNAGGVVVYELTFANVGDQDATGVVITETVPANTSFDAGSSTVGWTCVPDNSAGSVCTFSVGDVDVNDSGMVSFAIQIDNPLSAGVDVVTNTAVVADDGNNGPDPNPDNNADSDNTPVDAAPDLLISKTDSVAIVAPGGVIVYTLSFENIGTQNATGVMINEVVPADTTFSAGNSTAGWSCADSSGAGTACQFNAGAVNAGAAAQSIDFAVEVVDPLPGGVDEVVNSVQIVDDGSNGPDLDPGNNTDTENTPVGAVPDLYINKTDNDATSGPGGVVVYVLDYGNIGTQNATGVVITETVPLHSTFNPGSSSPGWVCAPDNSAGSACQFIVGALAVGDTGVVNFAVQIDDPLMSGVNELVNTASIADDGSNGVDPDPGNNTSTDNTGLLLEPPVGIKVGEFDATDNSLIHWTFYWFNPNNNRDLPVFVFDPIPDMTSYVSGSATCVATGTSSCTTPVYNATLDRLELNGVISPDEGAAANAGLDDLDHEIVIQFSTRITASGPVRIENQAFAHWDRDNDGDPDNDATGGQEPIPTDAPQTPEIGDPTVLGTSFAVPTLSQWALLLLSLMVIGVAGHSMRRW